MDPAERWRRIEELFHAALELDPQARPAFLQQACGDDAPLIKEVESLLDASGKTLDFVPQAVVAVAHKMSAEGRHEEDVTGIQPELFKTTITAGTELAHYRVISLLGAGGMGEVYLAEDRRLRRKVALKLLAPELTRDEHGLQRFEREACAASALNHPNILTVYEFGQADGVHFIVSEFVEGTTLRQRLASGKLELDNAIDIAVQIASALAAAHASGIVHRDIKPENVIIRSDGIVKVLDFGIAKLGPRRSASAVRQSGSAAAVVTTEPGLVRGTPKYMSPEQARGIAVDARSDIFSLGSVIYEMVAGRAAFEGETSSDVIAEILKVEPAPPATFTPEVPPELERIILKALRKDRATRYQSVADFHVDLQDFKKEAEFQAKLQAPARFQPGKPALERRTPSRALPLPSSEISSPQISWMWPITVALIALFVTGYFLVRKPHNSPAAKPPRSLAILPFRNLNGDPRSTSSASRWRTRSSRNWIMSMPLPFALRPRWTSIAIRSSTPKRLRKI
jgi:serine/threonine protein kinase